MAFVQIEPQTELTKDTLLDVQETVRQILRSSIAEVWQVPANDILINIQHCTVVSADPTAIKLGAAPDLLIKINTSGGGNFFKTLIMKLRAQQLARLIESQWKEEFGPELRSEVWITFFHTWGITFDL